MKKKILVIPSVRTFSSNLGILKTHETRDALLVPCLDVSSWLLRAIYNSDRHSRCYCRFCLLETNQRRFIIIVILYNHYLCHSFRLFAFFMLQNLFLKLFPFLLIQKLMFSCYCSSMVVIPAKPHSQTSKRKNFIRLDQGNEFYIGKTKQKTKKLANQYDGNRKHCHQQKL
ncbi:inhibitor of apoptosis 2 [Sarcoptes scabiei]|nr:inhibitor of apoptosis 2 [Sarcoptes scabiei]